MLCYLVYREVISMEDRQVDKINRLATYLFAPPMIPENITGINNTWLYNRAPTGYKFLLDSIQVSTTQEEGRDGIFAVFDGHEYTHWNIFPGVVSHELLYRGELNQYILNLDASLKMWECKEFSLALRSSSQETPVKVCVVIWFYIRKMTELEKLQYAVLQPKGDRYKKSFRTTVQTGDI